MSAVKRQAAQLTRKAALTTAFKSAAPHGRGVLNGPDEINCGKQINIPTSATAKRVQ